MNIRSTLQDSFTKAKDEWLGRPDSDRVHQGMSSTWVEILAAAFRSHYHADRSVHVFSKDYDGNVPDFGVNELLYDILVCRAETVLSARQKKQLLYFTECVWQIESELERNSKQAIRDFNKLVVGSAKNKLFIGPLVNDPDAYINVLLPAAKACAGDIYLALIPHPDEWSEEEQSIQVWMLNGRWQEITEA